MCDSICGLITVDNMMNVYYKREPKKVSLRDKQGVASLVSRKEHSTSSHKKSISGAQKSRTKKSSEPNEHSRKALPLHESNRKYPQPPQQVVVNTHINVVAHHHQLINPRQQLPPQMVASRSGTLKVASRAPLSPKTVDYKQQRPAPKQIVSQYFPAEERSDVTIHKQAALDKSRKGSQIDPYRLTDYAITRQCSAKKLIKETPRTPKSHPYRTQESHSQISEQGNKRLTEIPTQSYLPKHRSSQIGRPMNTFDELCPKSAYSSGENGLSQVSGESNVIECVNFRGTAQQARPA